MLLVALSAVFLLAVAVAAAAGVSRSTLGPRVRAAAVVLVVATGAFAGYAVKMVLDPGDPLAHGTLLAGGAGLDVDVPDSAVSLVVKGHLPDEESGRAQGNYTIDVKQ